MFDYHFNDARAHATWPAIGNAGRCVKFVGMVAILGWMWIGGGVRELTAGCDHYSGRIESQSGLHPTGYARNVQFLGRWIYEGGEAKYVPWEGSAPCQGPNCQADDLPGPDMANNIPSARNLPVACQGALPLTKLQRQSNDRLHILQGTPLSGFPSGFEYPP